MMAAEPTDQDSDSDSDVESGRVLNRLEHAGSEKCAYALSRCFPGMGAKHHICVLLVPRAHIALEEPSQKRSRLEDEEFHVLEGVLEEWSPVLTALLRHASLSKNHYKTIILDDFELDAIEHFIRFLYRGELGNSPTPELLWELARMGKYYDIPLLQHQCFAWLEFYACDPSDNSRWLVPSLQDLLRYGFELQEVCKCCMGSHLLRRFELALPDFLEFQFNDFLALDLEPARVAKLVLARGVSLKQITSGCISIPTLLERGWRSEDIVLCGFTFDEIRSAGIQVSPRCLFTNLLGSKIGGERRQSKIVATESVIAFGYRVDELLRDGFSSAWFQKHIDGSHNIFRAAGYSEDDLLHLGYAPRLLAHKSKAKAK